jgi:hypothetical protein
MKDIIVDRIQEIHLERSRVFPRQFQNNSYPNLGQFSKLRFVV